MLDDGNPVSADGQRVRSITTRIETQHSSRDTPEKYRGSTSPFHHNKD